MTNYILDARDSLHVAPEAAVGGPLALVQDGDRIRLDVGDLDGDHVRARGLDGILELNAPLVESHTARLPDRIREIVAGLRAFGAEAEELGLDRVAVVGRVEPLGFEARATTRDEFAKFNADEVKRWGDIVRALGMKDIVKVDVRTEKIQPGDIFLLCSDGLSDMVEDEDIRLTISTFGANLDTVAKQLIQLANENGGCDNVSVVLAQANEAFPASRGVMDKLLGWFS